MSALFEILLANAFSAVVLGLGVAVIARFIRRPAIVHALWVVVLLKLLAPPLVAIATLPRPATTPFSTAETAAVRDPVGTPTASGARIEVGKEPSPSLSDLGFSAAFLAWGIGSAWLLGLTLRRGHRFSRLLESAGAAPAELEDDLASVAAQFGLATRPRSKLVSSRISPMIWSPPGRCYLLLPAKLLEGLSRDERLALLAHELAHVVRRDHWVRYVELAAGVLFWWLPLVGWVRGHLRLAEEQSCDARVVEAMPERSHAYATGLLKTVEFLAGDPAPAPGLTTGAAEARRLQGRLTMIVNRSFPGSATPVQRVLVASLAVVALAVFPIWAEPPATEPEAENVEELISLRRARLELERSLRDVNARMLEIERNLGETQIQGRLDAMRREAELRGTGEPSPATKLDELRRMESHLAEAGLRAERHAAEAEPAELARHMAQVRNELKLRLADEDAYEAERRRAQLTELKFANEVRERNARQLALEKRLAALNGKKNELRSYEMIAMEEALRALDSEIQRLREELLSLAAAAPAEDAEP